MMQEDKDKILGDEMTHEMPMLMEGRSNFSMMNYLKDHIISNVCPIDFGFNISRHMVSYHFLSTNKYACTLRTAFTLFPDTPFF